MAPLGVYAATKCINQTTSTVPAFFLPEIVSPKKTKMKITENITYSNGSRYIYPATRAISSQLGTIPGSRLSITEIQILQNNKKIKQRLTPINVHKLIKTV